MTMNAFSLAGHRALITGGSGGLGRAIAKCFFSAGAEVILTGSNEQKLAMAKQDLGDNVGTIAFNVTDTANAKSFARDVESRFGPVSILVNNAGNTVKKPFADMTTDDFTSVMNTHVTGAFALSQAFLPQLKQGGRGSLLFTASMASFLGIPHVIGYSAAKSAYVGMVRSLATELAPENVRVNGVAPGWIKTDLFEKATKTDPARFEKIKARIPMDRFGTPEDIGWAMTYLASPAAQYVTGEILVVDGGALHGF
ncbi:SDR family NAD(P)-dependent oxidoreductase [Thalassospira mesophila]|uniref:3-oxoacyl-ACP reductase n=1 Tax=Thalassospira mesophila TaxID=1293891 RepID=A0A1Y2KX82_9PROT|nr:SDR family oxidoreductase [Thalassospira mesophila]OSQ36722.1 3-oxoacyl-ACP reductase [Thalassospira mesophila]